MLKNHTWLSLTKSHQELHRRDLPHNCKFYTQEENRLFFLAVTSSADFPFYLIQRYENTQN